MYWNNIRSAPHIYKCVFLRFDVQNVKISEKCCLFQLCQFLQQTILNLLGKLYYDSTLFYATIGQDTKASPVSGITFISFHFHVITFFCLFIAFLTIGQWQRNDMVGYCNIGCKHTEATQLSNGSPISKFAV